MFMQTLKDEEEIHSFNYSLYKELSHMFRTNETIKHCYDTLERFLFQNIRVKGATPVLNEMITYFSKFCSKVLKYLWIMGWCPYTIEKIRSKINNEDIMVPKVIPIEYITAELVVNKLNFTCKMSFYDYKRDKAKNNIYFVTLEDIQDLANHSIINSPLSSILPDYRFLEQLKKFTIQSEFIRSNPAIFLVKKDPKKEDVTNHRDTEEFGLTVRADDTLMGDIENNEQIPTKIAAFKEASDDIVKNVEYHNQQMEEMVRFQNSSYYDLGLGFRPQTANNLFVCPPNMTLAAPPRMPEVKSDILTISKKFASVIFLALGMPETIFGFGSQNNVNMAGRAATRTTEIRKDINVMDVNSFDATLKKYNNIFSNLFCDIYFTIFKKRLKTEAIEFHPPKLYEHYTTYMLAEIKLKGEHQQMKLEKENEKIHEHKYGKDNEGDKGGEKDNNKRKSEDKESDSSSNKKSKE